MNYQITSDNIELSPSMQNLATEKFERIERLLKDYPEETKSVRIVLNKGSEEGTFTVKMHLLVNGREYFSDETEFGLETAVVNTVEELVRMIEKAKDR